MKIYVNGQDINELILADLESGDPEAFKVGPERFLKKMDGFLESRSIQMKDVSEAVVVSGPGSPTALRSVVTIMNTAAFACGVTLHAIKKDPDVDDGFLIKRIRSGKEEPKKVEKIIEPDYGKPPKVTVSKRDALRR